MQVILALNAKVVKNTVLIFKYVVIIIYIFLTLGTYNPKGD